MTVRDSLEEAARLENLAALDPDPIDAAMLRLAASDMRARLDVVEREPIDTSELRAALAAGADFAAGSEIIAARVLAAAARI